MPYIKKDSRKRVDDEIARLARNIRHFPENERDGVLNYVFTQLLADSLETENYLTFQRKVGILECCKLELYARAIRPYEDKKIRENGDVKPYGTS